MASVTGARLPTIPDGLVAVVKSECPACTLVAPVLEQLVESVGLVVYTQDDPSFPTDADWVVDDTDLAASWQIDLDAVPTLVRRVDGVEIDRTVGWDRANWESFTGVDGLGDGLPDFKPG
tara:strand:+ start:892 stop:1251 length:360 start_codon:yes stop_codon:yes gene_type:complete